MDEIKCNHNYCTECCAGECRDCGAFDPDYDYTADEDN